MEYEQLIPSLTVNKKAFYVTNDEYVTMEDGTGIVILPQLLVKMIRKLLKNMIYHI